MRYVAGLMFSESKLNVALVLKNRPKWQAGLFNAIGGKIEEGEDPAAAMVREFKEETGVETNVSDWEFHLELDGEGFNVVFFKAFTDKVYDVRTVETETIHLVKSYQLPANIIQNLRWIVPLALDTDVITPRLIKSR